MSFVWPELLWALLVLPALIGLYILVLYRRKKLALRYASLLLVKDALGARSLLRRHLPPALMLAAIGLLLAAVGRPLAVVSLPSQQETIILTMDVSGSMRATDVEPNRLVAAQNAARAFINDAPRHARIGVVAFAGTASLVQTPTLNRQDVLDAIDRFQLQPGTATGSGILVSLATLFPEDGIDVSEAIYGREHDRRGGGGRSLDLPAKSDREKPDFKPMAPGSNNSAAIIMLTDGQRTTGPDPLDAARRAAERGVRVFTVGFGTVDGELIRLNGWTFRARLDEKSLRDVASITHGEYFYAASAAHLKKIYEDLNSRVALRAKETEVTALFAAAGAALALVAAFLSLRWSGGIL
jgi:Ca-activated chloride channel family protein